MSRSVNIGVRSFGTAVVATFLCLAPTTSAAQTTVVLDSPDSEVADAYVRGGTYASRVHNTDALVTKANTNPSNVRRALLKFDTATRVPAGATIRSARLTLTLKKTDSPTRKLGVYRVTHPFQEDQATWYTRKRGYQWTSAGGDLSAKLSDVTVGTEPGSKITIDLTSLVQSTVKGSFGSRYTRVALVDIGARSNDSYKEFHSSESRDLSARPVLTIVYGGSATPTKPTPTQPTPTPTQPTPTPTQPTPTPTQPKPTQPKPTPTDPVPTTGSTLKVLHWNIHRAWGTDGKYSLDRIASWIAKMNPHVVSLNEVERYTGYANEDQPANLRSMLKSKTGATWYLYYRTGTGAAKGHGNAILSRFPFGSTSYCQLSGDRVAANVAINVNGRLVNFYSTHLNSNGSTGSYRIAEVKRFIACLGSEAEQKIIGGDFNAHSSATEIALMKAGFYDGWAEAAADRSAVDYPGNRSFGATRNGRIDYVWLSKAARSVVLKSAKVFDTRDANGRMPSDHKPLLVTFEVR